MFCYFGKFVQAVSWSSLPDRATKKKENCCSLSHIVACTTSVNSLTGLRLTVDTTGLEIYERVSTEPLSTTATLKPGISFCMETDIFSLGK